MAELSDTRVVALTNDEYLAAMVSGCMRRMSGRANKRTHSNNRTSDGAEQIDILGAVGEACVAKYLDRFWLGPGVFRGADVHDLQVRATSYKTGHLILSDDDSPTAKYILVYASDGVGHIRGWCYGREGQQEMYKDNKSGRGEQYYVPVSALHPMPDREAVQKKREKSGQ
jgi:hypothetical protein